jgi:hypothetical protein
MAISHVSTASAGTGTSTFANNQTGNALFAAFIAYGGSSPYTFPSTMTDTAGNLYNLLYDGTDVTFTQFTTWAIYCCPSCIGTTTLVQTTYVNPDGSPVANGTLLIRLNRDGITSDKQIQSNFIRIPLDSQGRVTGSPVLPLTSAITPSGTYYIGKVYNSTGQLVGIPFIVPVQNASSNSFTTPTSGSVATRSMGAEFSGFNGVVTLDQGVGPSEDVTLGYIQVPPASGGPLITIGDFALGMALNVSGVCNAAAGANALYTGGDTILQWAIANATTYRQNFSFTGGVSQSALVAAFFA